MTNGVGLVWFLFFSREVLLMVVKDQINYGEIYCMSRVRCEEPVQW